MKTNNKVETNGEDEEEKMPSLKDANCHTRHCSGPKKIYKERTNFWHFILLGENILFKKSPPSIMVTRKPNWSTEILWFGTG